MHGSALTVLSIGVFLALPPSFSILDHFESGSPTPFSSNWQDGSVDCVTGKGQCKAVWKVTTVPSMGHGCGIQVQMKPGDTMINGSCECDEESNCVKKTQCEFQGEIQIRVTGGGSVLTGHGCSPQNAWIKLGTLGSPGMNSKLNCGVTHDAGFAASCYASANCTAPTAAFITVSADCTGCSEGECDDGPSRH